MEVKVVDRHSSKKKFASRLISVGLQINSTTKIDSTTTSIRLSFSSETYMCDYFELKKKIIITDVHGDDHDNVHLDDHDQGVRGYEVLGHHGDA